MKTLLHIPETDLKETHIWNTEVLVNTDGTEQRIKKLSSPRRKYELSYKIHNESDIQKLQRFAFNGAQTKVRLPLFHQCVKLSANCSIGATTLSFEPLESELRPGKLALIFDKELTKSEVVTINSLTAGVGSVNSATTFAWTDKDYICPITIAVATSPFTIKRKAVNNVAELTVNFLDAEFINPYLDNLFSVSLTTFNSIPVLPYRSLGDNFSEKYVNSTTLIDYDGVIEIREPWTRSKLDFELGYVVHKNNGLSSWQWWRTFLSTICGSWSVFYVPTFRNDFTIVSPPSPSGTTMTLKGTEYATDYYPFNGLKSFAIFGLSTVHYATATNVSQVSGNTVVTFSPAIPSGGEFASVAIVSLLLRCRLSEDSVVFTHNALDTQIAFRAITVDD